MIDLSWKDGALEQARIVSKIGGSLDIRYSGMRHTFDIKPGQFMIVRSSDFRDS
jgi:hypothetical protein